MTFQSDSGRMRRVLLKHARHAFATPERVEDQWESLNYLGRPDYEAACGESDAFAELLRGLGVDVEWMPAQDTGMDSLYVRDASVVTDRGVILCNMGKATRRPEPAAQRGVFEALGIPILGAIQGEGRLEGGDVTWLGDSTLAVGRGYRTNDEGIAQLTELLGPDVEVVVVPLPHWRGPADVFHLMSVISPLADDLALVYSPLLPVPFRQMLVERGIVLVEVPEQEFDSMGCNVLAVAPRVAVAMEGNPDTRRRMEAAEVEVHLYSGVEISAKGCGGPTCLTRPLERAR